MIKRNAIRFSIGKSAAIQFGESQKSKLSDVDVVKLALYVDELCVSLDQMYKSCANVFGRPVYIHEFASPEILQEQFEKTHKAPDRKDIDHILNGE